MSAPNAERDHAPTRPLILIVEDDAAVGSMIDDYLIGAGFRTARAGDGREAVERVSDLRPDLIIMDLMMPRLTGGEAARKLRDDPLTTHIPILGISAVADITTIAEMLPIDSVLPKPFDLDDLLAAIHGLLAAPDEPSSGGAVTSASQ